MLRTQLAEWSDKMAVFRYKMQGILNIKEKLETRAKQDFAEANNRLAEEKEKLAELQRRKAAYMEEGVALRLEHIDVRKIRENKMAVMKMDEYIARQIVQINQAAKAVEIHQAGYHNFNKIHTVLTGFYHQIPVFRQIFIGDTDKAAVMTGFA